MRRQVEGQMGESCWLCNRRGGKTEGKGLSTNVIGEVRGQVEGQVGEGYWLG